MLSFPSNAGGRLKGTAGFSLIEVVLVVLIMGILAGVAAQKYSGAIEQSRFDATRDEMERLARAVVGDPDLTSGGVRSDFGYVGDVGALPPNLDALVTNPGGYATWDGPYIQSDFQQNPNDFKEDAWGVAYAYSGVTITSNGSGSVVTKPLAGSSADLTGNSVIGVVTDGLNNAPGASAPSVTVTLRYPNGSGSLTTATTNPSSGGNFSFSASVPVGNHEISAAYQADTVVRYVSVLPSSTAIANFRLPGDLWTPAGGGGGGSGLEYVAGSAQPQNSAKDFTFDVRNISASDISITGVTATYAAGIYYKTILVNGVTVFDNDNPRGGSTETKTFASLVIASGSTVAVQYQLFKQCVSGGCANGSVSGETFTIDFSDGSSATFTVP